MRLEDLDYKLPKAQIALSPCRPRGDARLLVIKPSDGALCHRRVHQLVDLLSPGDVVVLNNTKVIPARIFASSSSGRTFELLLLNQSNNPCEWRCLVRPGRRIRNEETLVLQDRSRVTVSRNGSDFFIRFLEQFPSGQLRADEFSESFFAWLATVGEPPIPPYLRRKVAPNDWDDYQTVFASQNGAVAAPTAGLHLTQDILDRIRSRGCPVVETTLHVGYSTFAPLTESLLAGDHLHSERFSVGESTLRAVMLARQMNKQVLCIGTTALRALESIPFFGTEGETTLFIKPGFQLRFATALLTNFHQPGTSLLALVTALLGLDTRKRVYSEAIRMGYRFLSYGDAMLFWGEPRPPEFPDYPAQRPLAPATHH